MVHVVPHSLVVEALLPTKGEGQLVSHGHPGVLPLCGFALVVHKVHTAIGQHPFLWKRGRDENKERVREKTHIGVLGANS